MDGKLSRGLAMRAVSAAPYLVGIALCLLCGFDAVQSGAGGVFPIALAGLGLAMAVVNFSHDMRDGLSTIEMPRGRRAGSVRFAGLALLLVLSIQYRQSFLLASFLFLFSSFVVLSRRSLGQLGGPLVFAVALAVSTDWIFRTVLHVDLP